MAGHLNVTGLGEGRSPRWATTYSLARAFFVALMLFAVTNAQDTTTDTSAVEASEAANEQSCIADGAFNSATDYFPVKVDVNRSSISYTVQYFDYYKIITNSNADPLGTNGPTNHTTVLYQCGTNPPDACTEEVGNSTRTVCKSIPLNTVGISDTVGITFLEILGVINKTRMVGSMEYVTSPCMQKWAQYLLDTEGVNISESNDPTTAEAQRASVDVYFQSTDNMVGSAYGSNTVYSSESFDFGALNRPDWLGFFAAFFNLEDKYNTYMTGLRERWYDTTNITANLTPKPVIAVINYLDYYTPNITYQVILSNYMNDSILGAGATTKAAKEFDNLTEFQEYMQDVDIIIDLGVNGTIESFLTKFGWSASDNYTFLQNQAVYAIDKRMNPGGGTDWFESVLAKPDVVLRDLVTMAHPGVLNRERTYLRNLYNETISVMTAADCTEEFGSTTTNDAAESTSAEASATETSGVTSLAPPFTLLAAILVALMCFV